MKHPIKDKDIATAEMLLDVQPAEAIPVNIAQGHAYAMLSIARTLRRIEDRMDPKEG